MTANSSTDIEYRFITGDSRKVAKSEIHEKVTSLRGLCRRKLRFSVNGEKFSNLYIMGLSCFDRPLVRWFGTALPAFFIGFNVIKKGNIGCYQQRKKLNA